MSDKPRLTLDSDAAKELEALLDDIHGTDRPTVGNGTYSSTSPWKFSTEGGEAPLFPVEYPNGSPTLHVTTDGQVWLNPDTRKFEGLCIGSGDDPIEDAVRTLEQAIVALYAYKIGGR